MMGESRRLLVNIDKNLSLTGQKVETLRKDFDEHKYSDNKRREKSQEWENMIIDKIKSCPESEHIRLQNGKVEYISNIVNEIKTTTSTKNDIRNMMIKIISVGISLFIALLAAMKYFE